MSFRDSIRAGLGRLLLAVVLAGLATVISSSRLEAQTAGRVYTGAEVHVAPKIKSVSSAQRAIEKNYPSHLKREGGRVELMFIIDPDGKVDAASIEVVETTHADFGEAARKAIQQINFSPGEVDGKSVRTMVKFPIVFAPT